MGVSVKRHDPAALPLGKGPSTNCPGGWVDLRAGLQGCRKSCPHQDWTPRQSSLYPNCPACSKSLY